jgi:tetratricopeptide (TPR) repeat protein
MMKSTFAATVRGHVPPADSPFEALAMHISYFAAGSGRRTWWGFAGLLLLALLAGRAEAQLGRGEIPNAEYWLARSAYYSGDFLSAQKAFQDAAKSGVVTPEGRWVDSICFHTMLGECYYESGDLAQAVDQYASALKLLLAHENWMLQIEFPPGIGEGKPAAPITWGNPTRATRLGNFPSKYRLLRGTLNIVPADGGESNLVPGMEAIPVRAAEIVRCTALAIRRRREIMGPTSAHDRLNDQVLTALSRRLSPPNNWSQCWVSVQLGLAYSASGKPTQALSELAKGLQAGGTYDHVLTSLALLEMADIYLSEGKYDLAGTHYLEATYSASQFELYDDMEAGFRGALLCWHATGKNALFTPLAPATAWAGRQNARKLEVALRLLAAENLTLQGDTAGAAVLLSSANKAMLRREMQLGRPGARWNFEMARVGFAEGSLGDGATHLAAAMKFQQASSRWLFQIQVADALATSGGVTEREADLLYTNVLRDPTAADWSLNPLESLVVASSSYAPALEHWFSVALARKDPEKALEIADRLRRHRFYSTLPLGGRLLALRWILEAPAHLLDEKATLQRQALLVKYPKYGEVSLQASRVTSELDRLPLIPEKEEERKRQHDLLAQLAKLSAVQEVMLRNIALRPEPSEYVFPPALNVKALQAKLPERTLVLCYINIGGKLFGFAVGKQRYASFPVDTLPRLKAELTGVLKTWGHLDKNQTIDAKDLNNATWNTGARRLLKALSNNMKDESWTQFDELVVVPDSLVWYVPFEALPLADAENAPPLISQIRVRYVPTLALAAPESEPKTAFNRTAVVAGKLFPRDDVELAVGEYERILAQLPTAARLMGNLPVSSSLLASQFDQLIVYHDLDEAAKGPYDWSPCPVDKGKAASALSEWFSLPWGGPRQVILPGFHTPAEASLRRGGTGDELFLTACAFLASGSKTVLLSRWRTAGQASYDLTREFAVESSYLPASAAWQRSVQLAMQTPLDHALEPRLKSSEALDGLTASHPFFWSGYMLIDTGSEPKREEAIAEKMPEAKEPDAKAEEKKPAAAADDKKPDDKKLDEKKLDEKKLDEKKLDEKKPDEKKKPDDDGKLPKKLPDSAEVDGKLPPDLEALRRAPARVEEPLPKANEKPGRKSARTK